MDSVQVKRRLVKSPPELWAELSDAQALARRLDELRDAARGEENLMPRIREALRDRCSLGEVWGAMRDVFGEYQPDI